MLIETKEKRIKLYNNTYVFSLDVFVKTIKVIEYFLSSIAKKNH